MKWFKQWKSYVEFHSQLESLSPEEKKIQGDNISDSEPSYPGPIDNRALMVTLRGKKSC